VFWFPGQDVIMYILLRSRRFGGEAELCKDVEGGISTRGAHRKKVGMF
jgi:hypothetical protein